jgi:signal transduction histidine kinase/ActR/RegA family two-component response regulator
MYAILNCIAPGDDYRLVALAALVCLISAWTSLSAYQRALAASGGLRRLLVALTAVAAAAGVWSTHFLAMLAYQPSLDIRYDLPRTAASLLMAWCGLALGFWIPARSPSLTGRLAGGAVVGVSIAVMHFTGVAAMQLQARLIWNPLTAFAAVALAVAFGSACLAVGGSLKRRGRMAAAVALLAVAICALHFTAMNAVVLLPDPSIALRGGAISRLALAGDVAAFVALMLTGAAAVLGLNKASTRSALAELRAALDSAPSAIAFFDRSQRLFFWNAPFAAILRLYGLEARSGLPRLTLMARIGRRTGPPDTSSACCEDGAASEVELPDGRWIRAEMNRSADGGLVAVLTDITDQRLAVVAAAATREEAEAASRQKSEFVANMSHEIRTPLNAVLRMAQVMDRHPLEEDQRQRLDVIRRSGEALLGLLNNVLDISKIESGKLDLEECAFDLDGLLAVPTAAMAALAAERGVEFTLQIDPLASGGWVGDAARLNQVVSNLLSNALKFTPSGEVGLIATAGAHGLRLEVHDTGVGIAPDKLETVFDKFTQADSSTTRRFGGTGLGLSISRELVDLMGGQLWAESREGAGSVFVAEIPLRRARAPQPALAAPPRTETTDDRPLRILAAEDNPTNRLVLTALLEPLEAEVILAEDGRQAVEAWSAGHFDLILMDVQMPGMNGVEAAQEIRRLEADRGLPETPILALTANVMTHQVEEYRAAGMCGHVAKPIDVHALFLAIDAALRDPRRAQAAPEAAVA